MITFDIVNLKMGGDPGTFLTPCSPSGKAGHRIERFEMKGSVQLANEKRCIRPVLLAKRGINDLTQVTNDPIETGAPLAGGHVGQRRMKREDGRPESRGCTQLLIVAQKLTEGDCEVRD
jgi:hypothetical protein